MNSQFVNLISCAVGASCGTSAFWQGGKGSLFIEATNFCSGYVILETKSCNGTWLPVAVPGTITTLACGVANGVIDFALAPGQIRARNSTGSAVYASAVLYQI